MEKPNSELVVHEVNGTVEFKGAQSVTSESIAGRMIDYLLSDRSTVERQALDA